MKIKTAILFTIIVILSIVLSYALDNESARANDPYPDPQQVILMPVVNGAYPDIISPYPPIPTAIPPTKPPLPTPVPTKSK